MVDSFRGCVGLITMGIVRNRPKSREMNENDDILKVCTSTNLGFQVFDVAALVEISLDA